MNLARGIAFGVIGSISLAATSRVEAASSGSPAQSYSIDQTRYFACPECERERLALLGELSVRRPAGTKMFDMIKHDPLISSDAMPFYCATAFMHRLPNCCERSLGENCRNRYWSTAA
jgi:hypothetical protein